MSLIAAARSGLARKATTAFASRAGAVRAFAAAPAKSEAEDDFVFGIFKEQQRQFRELLTGLQAIPVPLTGNEAAIAQYAQKVEALKKKAGAPTIADTLATQTALLSGKGPAGPKIDALLSSLESAATADAATDAALKQWASDVKAFASGPAKSADEVAQSAAKFVERLQTLTTSLPAPPKDPKAIVLQAYQKHVDDLRKSVEADVEKVKGDSGLDWVNVDLAKVSPKV